VFALLTELARIEMTLQGAGIVARTKSCRDSAGLLAVVQAPLPPGRKRCGAALPMLRPSILAPWGNEMRWEKVSQPVALTSPACGKTEGG
jgi:hypothetical protein